MTCFAGLKTQSYVFWPEHESLALHHVQRTCNVEHSVKEVKEQDMLT